ncbi:outer membrane beta-barrel protein [Alteromonadaceae bacterium 2753L.S.0a.02]|nr:outer membrane beta-barrel protein [Alteromonadaceae bacterium 2753L.S.0a.02]
METRFQHLLLGGILTVALGSSSAGVAASGMDREFIDAGVFAGLINIQDFGSEWALGANLTFKATEDFFLQFNFLQAEAGLSSFEKSQGRLFSGSDRNFQHYDLLVGYNLFQSEFIALGAPNLSSLYVVGGVGDTGFGGEQSFTYTLGTGYQVAFARNYIVRLDYRDYVYTTNLITEDKTVHNGLISLGFSYLF